MKYKETFLVKLIIFYNYLRKKPGIIVRCNLCGSYELKITKKELNDREYSSEYECLKCGATAENLEVWEKAKNKEEI